MVFKVRGMKTFKLAVIGILLAHMGFAQKGDLSELEFVANVDGVKEMTQNEVVNVFRNGRSLWDKGQKVIIVLPSNNSPMAETVATNLYRGSVSSMQKFWLALVFQGRSNPPVFLQTPEEIINYIKNNPGSIGVLPKGSVQIPGNLELIVK